MGRPQALLQQSVCGTLWEAGTAPQHALASAHGVPPAGRAICPGLRPAAALNLTLCASCAGLLPYTSKYLHRCVRPASMSPTRLVRHVSAGHARPHAQPGLIAARREPAGRVVPAAGHNGHGGCGLIIVWVKGIRGGNQLGALIQQWTNHVCVACGLNGPGTQSSKAKAALVTQTSCIRPKEKRTTAMLRLARPY